VARRIPFATVFFVQALIAASAVPAAGQPPSSEDCLACHEDGMKRLASSAHGPLACVDCHQDLAALQEYPHPEKLERVSCGVCHTDVASEYSDSIHARAIERAGLVVAPSCVNCHGAHDITPTSDRGSRVFRANVPGTCGTCHAGIIDRYKKGVHATALGNGNPGAPVCNDCHTAHQIVRADTPAWRLSVAAECGTCHGGVVDSFRRTFHGKVTELGFTRVAMCADCHGAHDILPPSNPESMVSSTRLVETCGKCHQGANEKFVQYDPHPDPNDYSRSPLLWWINRFYTVLIAGCFGLFGLHSLLWFRRERHDRKQS
jgi:hypothetical protein